jgi:RHS repeat-associated protein
VVTTSFECDGWDCIAETNGAVTTRYYAPESILLSFERRGSVFQVHADAVGSVRMVTDDTGAVVARFEYGAWGEVISDLDNVPGGMPYRFVGGLGCRADSTTGLVYMRNRWYDSSDLQRFLNKDALHSSNRYRYADDKPCNLIDSTGLAPEEEPWISLPDSRRESQMTNGLRSTLDSDPWLSTLRPAIDKVLQNSRIEFGIPLLRKTLQGDSGGGYNLIRLRMDLSNADLEHVLLHELLHYVEISDDPVCKRVVPQKIRIEEFTALHSDRWFKNNKLRHVWIGLVQARYVGKDVGRGVPTPLQKQYLELYKYDRQINPGHIDGEEVYLNDVQSKPWFPHVTH